ncbi:Glu/Leu/Phe/Val dehydrogenase [Candidatus Micrarchaeota archaeon]|nr:Glu/Leu/Phe/Val dehydrogenase [Candidatus Micrarchaeota archaeon]
MSVFENAKQNLEKASKYMNLSDGEKELLLNHKIIHKARLNVNGKGYDAWRIIHNDALGPGKGGIRFHPNVSEDEVKSLSFWMSLKNSLAGIPYGGAKGGVKVNPKDLSKEEIEEVSRAYVRAFHRYIGQDKDIPAPDVYTNPQVMAWMLDEYERIKGRHEPGMITGKPVELGGCEIRGYATSKGGKIILNFFLDKIDEKREGTRVVIQGFGNAGMNIAKMLFEDGYKIIAVSDSKGGIMNLDGLDIKEVIKIKEEKKSVTQYSKGKRVTNKELLELDTDVLVLAALENQITKENADNIKAKYILELANGPITYEADEILNNKNIKVIPDILANSGGVIVSYCEWVQNRTGQIFSKEYMENILKEKLERSFNKTYNLYKERNVSLRMAAYMIAMERILKAEKSRGNLD